MKLAAWIDDGFQKEELCRDTVRTILSQTAADGVVAVMAGPIANSGYLLRQRVQDRAEKLRRSGVKLVVEAPVHGVILKPDTYYYVLAMLLQKMNCVETLYLPCCRGDAALLEQCAQVMLLSSREYQQALRQLRRGRELHAVIPEAVERFVPGAKAVLSHPVNRLAAEMRNALKLSYCPTKAFFSEVPLENTELKMDAAADNKLGKLISEKIAGMEVGALTEIFGSTTGLAGQLKELCGGSFTAMTEQIPMPALDARQLLLRTALNYRNITHSMCALYSYVPSIRILSGDAEAIKMLTEKANVPVVGYGEGMTETEILAYGLYDALYESEIE